MELRTRDREFPGPVPPPSPEGIPGRHAEDATRLRDLADAAAQRGWFEMSDTLRRAAWLCDAEAETEASFRKVTRRKLASASSQVGHTRGGLVRSSAVWEVSVSGQAVGRVRAGAHSTATWLPTEHGIALGLTSRAVVRGGEGVSGVMRRVERAVNGG